MEEQFFEDEKQSARKMSKPSEKGKTRIAVVITFVVLVIADILLGIIVYNGYIAEKNTQDMFEIAFQAWKEEATRVAAEKASRDEADAAFRAEEASREEAEIALRAEEASRAEAEAFAEAEEIDVYRSNLRKVTTTMADGSDLAQTMGKKIASVWFNSIYKKEDATTDKFTRPNGVFLDDFNDALRNLFSDASFLADLEKINKYAVDITNTMKDLTNPPKGFEKACDCLTESYGAYMVLYFTVADPSGNYQTFSDNLDEATRNLMNTITVLMVFSK